MVGRCTTVKAPDRGGGGGDEGGIINRTSGGNGGIGGSPGARSKTIAAFSSGGQGCPVALASASHDWYTFRYHSSASALNLAESSVDSAIWACSLLTWPNDVIASELF